jgi:hypothetical protein
MATIEEIEIAVSNLPPADYARFRDWFAGRDNHLWDKEIEEDSASGALDHIVQEIKADIAAGRVKPLDEILNGS